MRAEERRNQRRTRGCDANPIRSLETPANVTVGAFEESRGLVQLRTGSKMVGMRKLQQ